MGMRLCAWHDREQGGETGHGDPPAPAAQPDARETLTLMPKQCCQSSSSNSSMGTPASVASSPSAPWPAPAPRARKKASANIFKDIDLLQIQTLFRTSGDECAEERARIICNYAGDRRVAEALVKLRRKKRDRTFRQSAPRLSSDRIGALSVQHFSKLCIRETGHRGSTSTEEDSDQPSAVDEDSQLSETKKRALTQRTPRKLRNKQQRRISGYLHEIKR